VIDEAARASVLPVALVPTVKPGRLTDVEPS
jgi:hypothetical protein